MVRTIKAAGAGVLTGMTLALSSAHVALAGTVTASNGLSFSLPAMKTPPGAGDIDTVIGYGLWLAAAACFGGVVVYVMQMVSSHTFGRSAVEHNGKLVACLAGALILGVSGSLVNGLM